MAATNIILGYGETLTQPFTLKRGSGLKKYPYNIAQQREYLGKQLDLLLHTHHAQPPALKPRGESVARFTLHPAFLAKTHHPNNLLKASGLRCVGSRSARVVPRDVASSRQRAGEETFTASLYVAGTEVAFSKLKKMLFSEEISETQQKALCRFELMEEFSAADKNFARNSDQALASLEVVLHAAVEDADIIKAFASYVASLGGTAEVSRALSVSALTFIPVRLAAAKAQDLAAFQFVRAVRVMPSLRIGGRDMRSSSVVVPALTEQPAIDTKLRVAVFDGGIGHTDLGRWVQETILPGAETTSAAYLNHGNGVTSALLFGPLDEDSEQFPRPYADVHHYRCISPSLQLSDNVPDVDLYDVLKNIDHVLKTEQYDFVNFSIGPYMPMDDDEVHPWTALIDSHLASGKTLAAIAVGNDGEKEWPESRVQPPSDMVNALAVGACNGTGLSWERAPYS